jgi:hypothetical protein
VAVRQRWFAHPQYQAQYQAPAVVALRYRLCTNRPELYPGANGAQHLIFAHWGLRQQAQWQCLKGGGEHLSSARWGLHQQEQRRHRHLEEGRNLQDFHSFH